jgi:hypothetical protein
VTDYTYAYDRENPRTLWDALNGWSEGTLSWKEAIRIGGLEDRFDLVSTALEHGVPVPGKLSAEEVLQAWSQERQPNSQ